VEYCNFLESNGIFSRDGCRSIPVQMIAFLTKDWAQRDAQDFYATMVKDHHSVAETASASSSSSISNPQPVIPELVETSWATSENDERTVEVEEEEEDNDADEEEYEDEDSTGKRKNRRSENRQARKQLIPKFAAKSSGTARLSGVGVERIESDSHVLGRTQTGAKEKGRGSLGTCANGCGCSKDLKVLADTALLTAKRTAPEKKARTQTEWNYARLKPLLEVHAFDAKGNYRYHSHCLATYFGVSATFVSSVHRSKLGSVEDPTEEVDKHVVEKDDLFTLVVVPENVGGKTQLQYVRGLLDNAKVTIVRRPSSHGLSGKTGSEANKSNTAAREAFRTWAGLHMAPSGSTIQADGQLHGAPYYFDADILVICRQKVKKGGSGTPRPDHDVLSMSFINALRASKKLPEVQIPGATTVERWIKADYTCGPGALVVHCVIHPQSKKSALTEI